MSQGEFKCKNYDNSVRKINLSITNISSVIQKNYNLHLFNIIPKLSSRCYFHALFHYFLLLLIY